YQVDRRVRQVRGAVRTVDGGEDVVARALEDHPLQLPDTERVLDDQDPRLRARPRGRLAAARLQHQRRLRPGRGELAQGQLAHVEHEDHAAVAVDGGAGG